MLLQFLGLLVVVSLICLCNFCSSLLYCLVVFNFGLMLLTLIALVLSIIYLKRALKIIHDTLYKRWRQLLPALLFVFIPFLSPHLASFVSMGQETVGVLVLVSFQGCLLNYTWMPTVYMYYIAVHLILPRLVKALLGVHLCLYPMIHVVTLNLVSCLLPKINFLLHGRLVKRILRASRSLACSKLTSILNAIVQKNDHALWM